MMLRRSLLAISLFASFSTFAGAYDQKIIKTSSSSIDLKLIGRYESGLIDESAAEIVTFDPLSKRLFVSNANDQSVDVISIRNPRKPKKVFSIPLSDLGEPNSVATNGNGLVAIAVANAEQTEQGLVLFVDANGKRLTQVNAGVLPDMLTFTPNGQTVLVANEGEPDDDYTIDPEGSVSIIDLSNGVKTLSQDDVTQVSFTRFNGNIDPAVRIFGPNASVAQDLEPEYIAVSADSQVAWVALQENNAMAIIDIAAATVVDIVGLGTKDHSVIQNALDASNRDDAINIRPWPVVGMYQPDAIASYEVDGKTYILSANEGDARDYDGFSEEERVKDLTLDESLLAAYPDLQEDENLGRLKTTTANGDTDGDGDTDVIHAYGARSFSIWNESVELVYDSGSDFGRLTAALAPEIFNLDEDTPDDRSDDKGAEPESIAIGQVGKNTYAFIGLERTGGIMVYDITSPIAPRFIQYINNFNPEGDIGLGTAGDVAPEGLIFIDAADSPINKPLLVVANEVSGTTSIYRIHQRRQKNR